MYSLNRERFVDHECDFGFDKKPKKSPKMCRHVVNAQVSIRAPCCKKWFDCPECHAEQSDHPLQKTMEMQFACKKCKKCFRKDMTVWDDESDSFCPHCDNCFVIEAVSQTDMAMKKGTKLVVEIEGSGGSTTKVEQNVDLDALMKEHGLL